MFSNNPGKALLGLVLDVDRRLWKPGRDGDHVRGGDMRLSGFLIGIGLLFAASAHADGLPSSEGSLCYREGMTEMEVLAVGDGGFEIGIESVQGGDHFCTLAGTAERTAEGYSYSARLDDGTQCQLSIVIGDSGDVAFRDPDWICKQAYCGARAAFEHIRLSGLSRVPCD